MIAYICEQGAKIRREGQRLVVCGKGEPQILFSHKLEQLLIFGNIHLTAQARALILSKGIDTVFLSSHGAYRGRLVTCESENVFLRRRQYALLDDSSFRLARAREIVTGKLHNQGVMLRRLNREHGIIDASAGAEGLKTLAKEAEEATEIESLRGVEGRGAAIYFNHFPLAFHADWGFRRRVRRPPTDPVNAILSLVYTLLTDRCHAACRTAGLDPFPANLHSLEYGRHSLPLDLIEEFRPIFADALTLLLFNNRILKAEDFEKAGSDCGDQESEDAPAAGIKLCMEGMKKVLKAFAKKMETSFHHSHAGREMSYSEALHFQAAAYRNVVEGKAEAYKPVLWH